MNKVKREQEFIKGIMLARHHCPKCKWDFEVKKVAYAMCGLCGRRDFKQGWVLPVPFCEMNK